MKKTVSFLLALLLLASLVLPASARGKISYWAEPFVDQSTQLQLMTPLLLDADLTKPMTRLEFAELAVRVFEVLSGTKQTEMAPEDTFSDCSVPTARKAYTLGIVQGVGNGRFAPMASLTREQAATMLNRTYACVKAAGGNLVPEEELGVSDLPVSAFADDDRISDWARPSVTFMHTLSIIDGFAQGTDQLGNPTENRFEPQGLVTREQALKMAVGMVNRLQKKNVAPPDAILYGGADADSADS